MSNAEKRCRKIRMGGFDFSLEVIVLKNRRDVCNLMTRRHEGTWIDHAIIKHREKVCGIQQPLGTTLTEAERAYKICSDDCKILKPDTDAFKEWFLARKLKEEVVRGNSRKAKEIKSIKDRYIERKTWGSIGSALQNKRGGRVSAVEICHNGIYNRYEGKERL